MRLKEGLTLRHIGNDYVIVVPGQGVVNMTSVYTLNETAAQLWEQFADKHFTVSMLTDLLLSHYSDVQREQAEKDVEELIDKLKEYGLILE